MADFTVGQTARASNYLLTEGQTFTRITSTIDGEEIVWNPAITDLGGGAYEASQVVNLVGVWAWYALATDGTPWVIEWDVDSAGAAGTLTATTGNTRQQLRRWVGKAIGDCIVVEATANGTNQSFVDDNNLDGPNNAYNGFDLYFVGGTALNLGQRRRITASSQSESRVTWNKILPAETAEGDEAELWNVRGIGIKPTEVNEAIDWALAIAAKHVDIPIQADVVAAFDVDSPRLTIPASLTKGMYQVVWTDTEDVIRTIDRANDPYDEGWYYEPASHKVIIGGSYVSRMDGLTITISGFGIPAPLESDSDTTEVDPEWIVAEAVRRVIAQVRIRNPEAERWLPPAWQESNQKRPYASGRGHPNTVYFR